MKGIILAGGSGSRLHPLTKVTNKHLLPVYNKPMICYPLERIIETGIKDIMIVSGRGHAGHFLELLGSGQSYGIRLTYEVQEKAGGIAQALGLCKDWASSSNILVILGDNIFDYNLKAAKESFNSSAHIFLKEVIDPNRYGVACIFNNKIVNIIEKPTEFFSSYAVTGIYMYDNTVFNIINELKPSNRGELEITDVNNYYINSKASLDYSILDGFWSDAGTFDTLALCTEHERSKYITTLKA